jgi:hypothetical protein
MVDVLIVTALNGETGRRDFVKMGFPKQRMRRIVLHARLFRARTQKP